MLFKDKCQGLGAEDEGPGPVQSLGAVSHVVEVQEVLHDVAHLNWQAMAPQPAHAQTVQRAFHAKRKLA